MVTMQCQICFDEVQEQELVTRLCGSECPAQICRPCLVRHLQVSLYQFYPGLLPKLRCPICLTFILREQWAPRFDDMAIALSTRYDNLCETACGFYSPCCHDPNYTQLPDFDESLAPTSIEKALLQADDGKANSDENDKVDHVLEALLAVEKSPNWRFPKLCRDFYAFQADASSIVTAFLDRVFTVESPEGTLVDAGKVFNKELSRIRDPERRASLLLWYLYKYPSTHTRCCDRPVCFNCKRATDHKVCQRKEEEAFDEETCMVQCRQCRAWIVMVEGCDTVICLCGFSMSWREELAVKLDSRRHLIAVDIFDLKRFNEWRAWKTKSLGLVRNLLHFVHKRELRIGERELRIRTLELSKRMLLWPSAMAKLRLLVATSAWRIRFRKLLPGMGRAASTMRLQHRTRLLLETTGVQLRCFVWRRRDRKMRSSLESELFWAAYRRVHPEELEDSEAAEADLFAMDLTDDI